MSDACIPPSALFYPDPDARMMLLSATQTGSPTHWLLIPQSFFRPTTHSDRIAVPWTYWSQFCLIREFPAGIVVDHPQVVGSHITYLERDFRQVRGGGVSEHVRLGLIDFASHNEHYVQPSKTWTLLGKLAPISPKESSRELPATTTHGLPVKKICTSEDNIVVVLVCPDFFKNFVCLSNTHF